jgi:hypothetical protein
MTTAESKPAGKEATKAMMSRSSSEPNQTATTNLTGAEIAATDAAGVEPMNRFPSAVIVTRQKGTFSPGCSPSEVAHLLIDIFDAVNRNDKDQLTRLFPSSFNAYSVHDSRGAHFTTQHRDKLLAYIAERHKQHEHIRLLGVDVAQGISSKADIVYYVSRQADDLSDNSYRIADAKGSVFCEQRWLWTSVMNTWPSGTEAKISHALTVLCPQPPVDSPENAVIACARNSSRDAKD